MIPGEAMDAFSLIIPCHNEGASIRDTVVAAMKTLEQACGSFEIIVVDDGSTDDSPQILQQLKNTHVQVITHPSNLGYGACLKSGIAGSRHPWIGICDGDGTYPVDRFPELFEFAGDHDMVVGERTGKIRAIPLMRRPAKWFLNKYASFLVNRRIRDVNSGMRIFKRESVLKYWSIFPDGFSFTTTQTLAMIMGNHPIKYHPVDYRKRRGRSKIRPLRDTYNFIMLIMRTAMLFNPLRVLMPLFFFIFFLSLLSVVRDIYLVNLTDTTVILFIFSIIILMIGLLADLINQRFPR
jgi:glycosyltransferase involved in cell wall biosynthesis